MVSTSTRNKFCKIIDLKNESNVEQFFVIRLLADLGFNDSQIKTKDTLDEIAVGKGSKSENYRPDYAIMINGKPRIIIDAKDPKENLKSYIYQVSGYSLGLNQRYEGENPVQFFILTNGGITEIYRWDETTKPLLRLKHEDFEDNNPAYEEFKKILQTGTTKETISETSEFHLIKPQVDEIKDVFQKCHDLIYKRESLLPTQAFYEFTKIIFLKMNEDKRIHVLVEAGQKIQLKDLHFHTYWIDTNLTISPNPVNDFLFKRLVSELEELVEKRKKKSIFEKDEQIKLNPSTIRDVINLLQNYDLHGIDEDLNGRMFEVFLASVVRGKNLGAYFTPRNIVKLMVSMANIQITPKGNSAEIETVLDGCCGSGGFLIDAMAYLTEKIKTNPNLSHNADSLIDKLVTKHIYGIDSNPDIARIARINMYLHGDGGSGIYRANTLDKEIKIESGVDRKLRAELEELHKMLIDDNKKFDVIITNPPFATSYKSKDPYEKRIMVQYANLDPNSNLTYKNGTTDLKTDVKSNILFIVRYHDLLEKGGRLVIVVDNSLLNSVNFSEYRIWLRNNFIIKAVISLPKYSFSQSGAGGVTSILYLVKRDNLEQKQPPIFTRRVTYTGLSQVGKEIKENDLPDVLKEWNRFVDTGKLYLKGNKPIENYVSDTLFLIGSEKISDRLDAEFHVPSYQNLMKKIEKMKKDGTHDVLMVNDFDKVLNIDKKDAESKVFHYADLGTVDFERCEIIQRECVEDDYDELPDRAIVHVKENDVIFPLPYDSLGKVAIIPKWMDEQLVSNGFKAIRCKNYDFAILVWALIRSEIMQKQFLHVASGYTQRGISKEHLEKYIKFPLPKDNEKTKIIKKVKSLIDSAEKARKAELESYSNITEMMNKI